MSLKLLLYTFDWLPSVGGIQTVTTALARGLSSTGKARGRQVVSVTLVTATPANGMDDSKFPFRVIRRPRLWELIKEIRASDIVHVAGPSLRPLLIARILRKPTVIEHHGYQAVCPNGLLLFGEERTPCPGHFMSKRRWKCVQCNGNEFGLFGSLRATALTFARRALAARVSANIGPSRHICARLTLPRTQVIYHGVSPAEPIDAQIGDHPGPACFAFIGRLVHEKGADVLLAAAGHLARSGHDFRVKIVGDGPERCRLEALADKLGIRTNVEFLGWVAPGDLNGMLSHVTAVVMPSVCQDVAPLVAIEQMMQGRLIIASDVGGLGETVNGCGLTFPAGDAGALSSRMASVIPNPQFMDELRARARRRAVLTHSDSRMIDEHETLYRSLIMR